MRKLELDNFMLYEYNDSAEHKYVIEQIESTDPNKFLGDIKLHIAMINKRKEENPLNCAYIAYYKGFETTDDYPIGFMGLSYIDGSYQVSGGTLPQFRKQNLSSLLLQEFSEKMIEITNEEIVIKVDPNNIASQKVAGLVGYEQTDATTYKMR